MNYRPPEYVRCIECKTYQPFQLDSDDDQLGWYAYCPRCGSHTVMVHGIKNAVDEWNEMNKETVKDGQWQPVNNDYEWNMIRQM